MKYIAVFCSAVDLDDKYTIPAKDLAKLIAESGYGLVWGGSDTGLMKVIADGVQDGGGKIVGVSIKKFESIMRKNADEMVVAKDLNERKDTMLTRCDGVVAMVGGIGTLDEVTHILELKKHGDHEKPVVILNTDHFYDGLSEQIRKMKQDGFIKQNVSEMIYFAETPEDVMAYLGRKLDVMSV